MPQFAFMQVTHGAALLGILLAVASMPIGAHLGGVLGRRVLRVSALAMLLVLAGSVAWGAVTGDLEVATSALGLDGWLQLGGFFGIMYFIAYNFARSYLDDRVRTEAKEAPDA